MVGSVDRVIDHYRISIILPNWWVLAAVEAAVQAAAAAQAAFHREAASKSCPRQAPAHAGVIGQLILLICRHDIYDWTTIERVRVWYAGQYYNMRCEKIGIGIKKNDGEFFRLDPIWL